MEEITAYQERLNNLLSHLEGFLVTSSGADLVFLEGVGSPEKTKTSIEIFANDPRSDNTLHCEGRNVKLLASAQI